MIAPMEQLTLPAGLPKPEYPAKPRSQEPPTSTNYDVDNVGILRREYHQWVRRHPVGAASAAIAVGLAMGLLLKRRNRK